MNAIPKPLEIKYPKRIWHAIKINQLINLRQHLEQLFFGVVVGFLNSNLSLNRLIIHNFLEGFYNDVEYYEVEIYI